MTPPAPARRHVRAARQLLLGLTPVLVVGLGLLVVLSVQLNARRAPLAAAGATATATVTAVGTAPDGRGLQVAFPDDRGDQRTGVIELARALDVPVGARLPVRYDPGSPVDATTVHADGDAASAAVSDAVFGLVVVAFVVLLASLLTLTRLLGRPRLRRRPARRVPATHVVVRQGLLVRSWLELDTAAGLRRLPVHWAPELDRMSPGTRVEVHGDPARDRLVLPVVDDTEVWPSGRLRARQPRGDRQQSAADP